MLFRSPIKLQSLSGDIVVNPGTAGTDGINANGSGDILLQSLANGSITANANIVSGSGNITLTAPGSIQSNASIQTSNPGTIFLNAGSDISIQSITNSSNVAIQSGRDVILGSINAGTGSVTIDANRDIKDNDPASNSTNIKIGRAHV